MFDPNLILPAHNQSVIAGVDDATKCPVIGSIFVAGVVADAHTIEQWKKLGVKDSKLIAFKKRNKLAKIIKETALAHTIHHIPPEMIDNKTLNLNAWEMISLFKIVRDLQKQHEFESIIVDNWEVSTELFHARHRKLLSAAMRPVFRDLKLRFNRKNLRKPIYIPEHRADENHIIVGAASILAKSASDEQYRKLKRKYGDFGSGSPADPQTRLFVWQHRENPLPIIRTSWNTYKTLSILEKIEDDAIYGRVIAKKNIIS